MLFQVNKGYSRGELESKSTPQLQDIANKLEAQNKGLVRAIGLAKEAIAGMRTELDGGTLAETRCLLGTVLARIEDGRCTSRESCDSGSRDARDATWPCWAGRKDVAGVARSSRCGSESLIEGLMFGSEETALRWCAMEMRSTG